MEMGKDFKTKQTFIAEVEYYLPLEVAGRNDETEFMTIYTEQESYKDVEKAIKREFSTFLKRILTISSLNNSIII